MPSDGKRPSFNPRYEFEFLALRLGVHGPDAFSIEVLRRLMKSALWLETRCLLRSHGFTEADIMSLLKGGHVRGCACWDCVRRLRKSAERHRAKLSSRHIK